MTVQITQGRTTMTDVTFITVEEFANRIKMHVGTVRRAIRAGKIYATRPGLGKKSPYRIAESELERLQLQGMYEKKPKKGA